MIFQPWMPSLMATSPMEERGRKVVLADTGKVSNLDARPGAGEGEEEMVEKGLGVNAM